MVYKCKKDYYQAVIQFYGTCVLKGMSKGDANKATREKFSISSPDTIYKIIRRVIQRRNEENATASPCTSERR